LFVFFPPQHIAERAYAPTASITGIRARIAGGSQLVFRVNGELPFTVASLLDWSAPRLTPLLPLATAVLDPQVTQIELPYRLLLAPNTGSIWRHNLLPITHADTSGDRWTELWQTTMGHPSDPTAVWVAGARLADSPDPFSLMAITQPDRKQIAIQSRNRVAAQQGRADTPVERLSLSALGGWLDLDVAWADIPGSDVAAWRHAAAMGRDTAVRVTKRGFLSPFGHRAGLTTVTERRFTDDGFAGLRQQSFLTVLEPEKTYKPDEMRDMPLRTIRIETLSTPLFDRLDAGGFPIVDDLPFAFQMTGEDWLGQQSRFALPLAFVAAGATVTAPSPFSDETALDAASNRRQANLAGQAVAMAMATAGDLATTVATQTIDFGVIPVTPASTLDPPFQPRMDQASVDLPAVNRLLGGQGPVKIRIPDAAASSGAGQVVMELVDAGRPVATAAQQAGGFIAPALNVVGISRTLGPISGRGATPAAALTAIAGGNFDPRAFLGASTKIFGTIDLTELIPSVPFSAVPGNDQVDVEALVKSLDPLPPAERADALRRGLETGANANRLIKVPTMASRELRNSLGVPNGVDLTWLWKPKLSQPPGDVLIFHLDPPRTKFWISTRMVAREGETPQTQVEGNLTDFDLKLLDVITVQFERLRFTVEAGKSTEVEPEIGEISFGGKLNFVNRLQQALAAIGIDSPFGIDIQPTFVTASYSLGLPAISLGAISIENLRLSTALTIPFVESAGPVRIRFALAERSAPFLVTYSIFAGGGFFSVVLTTKGDLALEASLEFGGKLAIDVLVAKGGLYAMAGIYFSLTPGAGVVLEAYLRAGGFLEILELITISIEFYISLKYVEAGNKLVGEASVTACIEVLFFSECVEFTVKREIAGPGGSHDAPRFADQRDGVDRPHAAGAGFEDLVDLTAWTEYCNAFA
jgi:hypothetical protein